MNFEQENIMLKNLRVKTDTDSFKELFKKTSKMEHKKSFIPVWYQSFTKNKKQEYCLLITILIFR